MKSHTQRRSCTSCVTLKRRCDLKTPQCSRCLSKGSTCTYTNEPFGHRTPSAAAPSALTRSPFAQTSGETGSLSLNDTVIQDMDLDSLCSSYTFDQLSSLTKPTDLASSSITIPPLDIAGQHSGESISYMVNQVRSLPTTFVYQSTTPFIHNRMYRSRLPQVLRDAFTVCAVYLTMTVLNKAIVFGIIEAQVADLIDHSCIMSSCAQNLASVQALILVQIVQLFDGGT